MAEFIEVCPADEISEGERAVFGIQDRWIAIFNVDGVYYAIEDLCTHDGNILTEDRDGNPVPLEGYTIACPRHGAKFDIRDGRVLTAPAMVDVPAFEIRVENDKILINMGS